MLSTFQREMWEIGANVEQHNHWLLEKPPLERFTALDMCKFTVKCASLIFASLSFKEAERANELADPGALREPSARFLV